MRTIQWATLGAGLTLAGLTLAQAPALKFDVASLRPSLPTTDRLDLGMHQDGAQVRIVSLPLRDCIARAYRWKLYQVTGPEWLSSERFDLNAKLPEGPTADQVPEMLQSLLAERLQLKIHREKKDLPIHALVEGKPRLKLQESAPDAAAIPPPKGSVSVAVSATADGVAVDLGNGASYTVANNKFELKKVSMDMVGRQLERHVDRPIVDMTGLKGTYDLSLCVTQEDAQTLLIRAAVNAGYPLPPQVTQTLQNGSIASLFDGMEKLGLKDARKAPLDIVVVDQASKTPAES